MCVGSPILGQCWKSTPTFQLPSSPGDVLQASLKRSQSHFSPCLAVLLCFSLLQGLTLRAVSNQHQLHNFPLTVSLMNVNCNNNCGSFAAFLRLVLPNAPLRQELVGHRQIELVTQGKQNQGLTLNKKPLPGKVGQEDGKVFPSLSQGQQQLPANHRGFFFPKGSNLAQPLESTSRWVNLSPD